MRHIALISTSYPDSTPGSEAAGGFVEDFAIALAGRARVTVIAAGKREGTTTSDGVTVHRFRAPVIPLSSLNIKNPSHWIPILSTLRNGLKAVSTISTQDKPDHILALWALPSGYWARSASLKYGIPYSTWALGSDIWTLGRLPFIRDILISVIKSGQFSFADGYQLANDVEKLSGRECRFLASARTMPELTQKQPNKAPPYRLAYLGRWHPNKGIDLLLDALLLLQDSDWEKIQEVRICGGGPLENSVSHQVNRLQDRKRPVTLAGYLDKDQAHALFTWADYVLLPSRIESIPVVFSDALSCLCPLIATPVGDLPTLIRDNNVGVLAQDTSAPAIADAIRTAIQCSPAQYEGQITECLKIFDLESVITQLLGTLSGTAS